MLNHFLTKLLDHDSYKPQQPNRIQAQGNRAIRRKKTEEWEGGTLLFLVVLQPSLIVPFLAQLRLSEAQHSCSKQLRVEAAGCWAAGWEGPRKEEEGGVETMRPLLGYIHPTNKDCDLMERRERIDEDENKMWILSSSLCEQDRQRRGWLAGNTNAVASLPASQAKGEEEPNTILLHSY